MSSSKKDLPPPSYDQVVDIDNPSAPLLHQTFSGSVFGTSTIVTFELGSGSYPVSHSSFGDYPSCVDYSFVIRDFVGCVQAKGNVSKLNTTLQSVNGTEILQIRSCDSIDPTNPPNVIERFSSIICNKKQGNAVHTFEAIQNHVPIGLVKFSEKKPSETCLEIHHGNANAKMFVNALALGEYVIFRDHSSPIPLCNIEIPSAYASYDIGDLSFKAKVIFHQETGITTEEQLLCTAAAIAMKMTLTQLSIIEGAHSRYRLHFWFLLSLAIMITLMTLLAWGFH